MTKKHAKPQTRDTIAVEATPIPWMAATLLFWPIAIAGAALDLWSKSAVFKWLPQNPDHQYILINGYVRFIMRENEGAAFSMFRGWTFFLIGISIVALVTVIGIFFSRKIYSKLLLLALGCMTAGIIGNLYDRLFNEGRVRDFIDVLIPVIDYPWPTFNIADSLLCIGVGLMIIVNLKATTSQTHAPEQKEEH